MSSPRVFSASSSSLVTWVAAYFIPTIVVPLLLTTHVLVFRLLLRDDVAAQAQGAQSPFFMVRTAMAHARLRCRADA